MLDSVVGFATAHRSGPFRAPSLLECSWPQQRHIITKEDMAGIRDVLWATDSLRLTFRLESIQAI